MPSGKREKGGVVLLPGSSLLAWPEKDKDLCRREK